MQTDKEPKNLNISIKSIDAPGFELIFRELYSPLVRYAMQFVRVQENAEDIVQEIFVYLWNHKDEINIQYSVKSYLYTSAKNKCITFIKSKYSAIEHDTEDKLSNSPGSIDPARDTEFRELHILMEKAIEELPEKCRIIFSMSRYAELSYHEIAEMLKISDRTVESQIHIAIKKIKDFLRRYDYPLILGLITHFLINNQFL